MKEGTYKINQPWLVGIAIGAITVAYFVLMGTSEYPEPDGNLRYDIEKYAQLDNIETNFEELDSLTFDLESPRAMAIGPNGLYLAAENAVVVYDDSNAEVARHEFDGIPNCLAVAKTGAIYVGMPTFVQPIAPDGTLKEVWDGFSSGSYLTSIAINGDDIYVADAGRRVVKRFDSTGELLAEIGRSDPENDVPGLEVPSPYLDIAVNDEGHLWVVNPGKLGFERFRDDGEFVTSWYNPSLRLEGFSGCCNPTQIAFTSDGTLVTSEKGLVRLKTYDVTSGEFKELVAGSKLFPREQSVRDIVVDAQDRILVLDPRSDSVRIFARKESVDERSDQSA